MRRAPWSQTRQPACDARDAGGAEALHDRQVLAGEEPRERLPPDPLVHVAQRDQRGHALGRIEVVVEVDRRDATRLLGVLERLDHVAIAVEGPGPQVGVEILVRGRGVGLPLPAHLAHQRRDPRVARPVAVAHGVAAVDVGHPQAREYGDRVLAHPRRPGPLEEPHPLAGRQEPLLDVADGPRGLGLHRVRDPGQREAPRPLLPVERMRVGVAARLHVRQPEDGAGQLVELGRAEERRLHLRHHHRHAGGQSVAREDLVEQHLAARGARTHLRAVAQAVAVDVRVADAAPALGRGIGPRPIPHPQRLAEERERIEPPLRARLARELEADVLGRREAAPRAGHHHLALGVRQVAPGQHEMRPGAGPARDAPAGSRAARAGAAARTPSSSDPCAGARSSSGCPTSSRGTRARSARGPR